MTFLLLLSVSMFQSRNRETFDFNFANALGAGVIHLFQSRNRETFDFN